MVISVSLELTNNDTFIFLLKGLPPIKNVCKFLYVFVGWSKKCPKSVFLNFTLTLQMYKISVGQPCSWFIFVRLQHYLSCGGHKMAAYQDYERLCDKKRNSIKCRVQAYHRDGIVHWYFPEESFLLWWQTWYCAKLPSTPLGFTVIQSFSLDL